MFLTVRIKLYSACLWRCWNILVCWLLNKFGLVLSIWTPNFIDPLIGHKLKSYYIVKTPLWALQHCFSINNPSKTTYNFDVLNALELCNTVNGAFIICGLWIQKVIQKQNSAHPCNLTYDIDSSNSGSIQITTVALYFLQQELIIHLDLCQIQVVYSKGLWLHNHGLATTIFKFCHQLLFVLTYSDGMPDTYGQLQNFTDLPNQFSIWNQPMFILYIPFKLEFMLRINTFVYCQTSSLGQLYMKFNLKIQWMTFTQLCIKFLLKIK